MNTEHSSRRQFLLAGGASLVGAATLAACSTSSVVNSTGTAASTVVPPTAPPTTADAKAIAAAQATLRTATSLEYSIASFYDSFTKATYIDTQARSIATLFGNHHRSNATALGRLTTTAGGKPYTQANKSVDTSLVKPRLTLANNAKSSEQLIKLAMTLEDTAASNCTLAVGSLARQPERAGIMEVGAANARHAVVWRLMNDAGNFAGALPDALYSLTSALGTDAAIS